jgi:hypothetical protein
MLSAGVVGRRWEVVAVTRNSVLARRTRERCEQVQALRAQRKGISPPGVPAPPEVREVAIWILRKTENLTRDHGFPALGLVLCEVLTGLA